MTAKTAAAAVIVISVGAALFPITVWLAFWGQRWIEPSMIFAAKCCFVTSFFCIGSAGAVIIWNWLTP